MNELKELDLFLNNMTQKDRDYALANHIAYFFSKARLYLKIGPKNTECWIFLSNHLMKIQLRN